MYGYIYRITDLTNGKCYIGQHKYDKPMLDPKYHGSSYILKNQIKKHPENFLEEIIFIAATLDELNYFETYFIEHMNTLYPNGYNLNHGGDKYIQSEKTKQSKSEKMKGENNPNYGKRWSKERKISHSNFMKGNLYSEGRQHTEETKQKISNSLKDKNNGENNPNYKYHITKEELYDLYIIQDLTMKEISIIYGCSYYCISHKLKQYKISKK